MTPFFRLHVPETKILDALEGLSKGRSIRKVAAAMDVDKNTILKILRVATRQPRWFQVYLPREYRWETARAEALFRFIHERRRREQTRSRYARTSPPSERAAPPTMRGPTSKA